LPEKQTFFPSNILSRLILFQICGKHCWRVLVCGLQVLRFNLLQKEISEMRIAEVMTTDVEVIDSYAPLTEAAAKMKTLDVGLLPICDGDKLIGTLTDRDITVRGIAEGYDPSDTKVSDIMSTDLAYCFEDEEIEKALSLMEDRQIRRLPVLDREKRLIGIVSLGDLAVHAGQKERLGKTLEEVSQPATLRR
jgi:CBS domain-containing protein